MQKIYKLYNRDGADLYLENIISNVYKIRVDQEHEYVLKYVSINFTKLPFYDSYDPSGGPYLYSGYKLSDAVIDIIFSAPNGSTVFILKPNDTKETT